LTDRSDPSLGERTDIAQDIGLILGIDVVNLATQVGCDGMTRIFSGVFNQLGIGWILGVIAINASLAPGQDGVTCATVPDFDLATIGLAVVGSIVTAGNEVPAIDGVGVLEPRGMG
jgi:hypothetical protein